MAVLRVEEYGEVLKVILKPTKAFPVGYFYTDNNPAAIELINNYSWFLTKQGRNTCVLTHNYGTVISFHQEYANKVLDYYPDCIDHINRVELDNRNINLNVVTTQQNIKNQPTRGYIFDARCNCFQPKYKLNYKDNYRGSYKSEPEVLLATYQLRQEVYVDYDYNFYLDRNNDLDILDLEIIGKITTQQATYYHVKRYVESNPWYAYRYNLFDYCKQNSINIPSFSLDSQGFMIDNTGKRLCPY